MELSLFLSRHNFDPKSFKFTPKGGTKFPNILLDKTPVSFDKSDDSSESASDDSDISTESELERQRKKEKKKKKKKKKQRSKRRDSVPQRKDVAATHVILPAGWHVISHPVSREPIGMIDPNGTMRSLENSASLLGVSLLPLWT